jgi:hypothetical protein
VIPRRPTGVNPQKAHRGHTFARSANGYQTLTLNRGVVSREGAIMVGGAQVVGAKGSHLRSFVEITSNAAVLAGGQKSPPGEGGKPRGHTFARSSDDYQTLRRKPVGHTFGHSANDYKNAMFNGSVLRESGNYAGCWNETVETRCRKRRSSTVVTARGHTSARDVMGGPNPPFQPRSTASARSEGASGVTPSIVRRTAAN